MAELITWAKLTEHKQSLELEIKRLIEPHLWESGFVESRNLFAKDAMSNHIWLFHFGKDERGDDIEFEHSTLDIVICGFTRGGVITGSHGGGLAIHDYKHMSVEQLLFAHEVARKVGKETL